MTLKGRVKLKNSPSFQRHHEQFYECHRLLLSDMKGWSHSKSCSQCLDVQVEISDEWHSSVVSINTGAV